MVVSGWSKLLIPGTRGPDKSFASAPESDELFDLKSDPLEKKDLAAERPDEVKRLRELIKASWPRQ